MSKIFHTRWRSQTGDMCRKSNIPSLAEIHGRDRTAVEADQIQRRAAGEPVQWPHAAALSGQAEVTEAVSGGAHKNRDPIRARKSSPFRFPRDASTSSENRFEHSTKKFHWLLIKINFWEWERKFRLFIWTRWCSMNRQPRAVHRKL